MKKDFIFILTSCFLLSALLFQTSCTSNGRIDNQHLIGKYRLKYYPEIKGWDLEQIQIEELLTLNIDSSYIHERIYPQGGFEIMPDSGKWEFKNDMITLTGSKFNETRIFSIKNNGLIEPNCSERKDLSNILWAKE